MCSSGIPAEAMAKDYPSASTSSSCAVSCLPLRFASSLFYSSVGWTRTSIYGNSSSRLTDQSILQSIT